MSESALFLMFLLIFVLPFIIGGIAKCRELEQQPPVYKDYRITIEPVVVTPKVFPNTTRDITKEAKDILVALGFTATEAKQLISEAGPCNTVDELVQAALERVKI